VVATKTQAVIVVAGAQLPINNQLKKGAATAREMTTTAAMTMTMKTKGTAAAAVAAWRRWAAWWKLGGSGSNGRSAVASTIKLPPCIVAVAMMTPAATAVAGAQITINNQLKAGEATTRETTMTIETTMMMKVKATAVAAAARQHGKQLCGGGGGGDGSGNFGGSLASAWDWQRWQQGCAKARQWRGGSAAASSVVGAAVVGVDDKGGGSHGVWWWIFFFCVFSILIVGEEAVCPDDLFVPAVFRELDFYLNSLNLLFLINL
jgi:hypothetical protein